MATKSVFISLAASIRNEVIQPSRQHVTPTTGLLRMLAVWTKRSSTMYHQQRHHQQQWHSTNSSSNDNNNNSNNPSKDFIPFSEKNMNKVLFNEKEDMTKLNIDRSKFTEVIEVKVPEMGDENGESKIVKWYKNEGDIVQYADLLCDIQTKDFTFGMEIDDEEPGILDKIFFQAPSRPLKDNEVICILLHEAKKANTTAKQQDKVTAETTKPED